VWPLKFSRSKSRPLMVPRPLVARSPAGGGAFSLKIKITAGPVRISWSPEVKVGPEIFKVTDR
jgi:hypothetical protein